jgi:uncharacterized membrane protein
MRYWEIDFLRGFGIILMLISNFVTDLQIFLNYPYSLFWHAFALLTASIFVFTSGASFYVCYSRGRNVKKILRRFAKLMSLGLLITLTTTTLLKVGAIYFGILHFLALAWILAIPFHRFGFFNCFFGVLFILLYPIIDSLHSENVILLPIGITPRNFYTFDYFPIIPWFGIFLFGLTFGRFMANREPSNNGNSVVRSMCYIGRNSLKIYLIHQPIFVTLIVLMFGDTNGILLVF